MGGVGAKFAVAIAATAGAHGICSAFFFLQKSIVSLDLTCMTFFPMVSATLEQTTSHFCDALERRLNLVSGRDREGIIPEKQHLKTTHQEIRAK